jgi:hypothetical protein
LDTVDAFKRIDKFYPRLSRSRANILEYRTRG